MGCSREILITICTVGLQMRVRSNRILSEPKSKVMVPDLAKILALFGSGSVSKTISQINHFLARPSQKLCTELPSDWDPVEEPNGKNSHAKEQNGEAQAELPHVEAAAPQKSAKKARVPAPQPDGEPATKRQRKAQPGKQIPAAKKPTEKKAAKRKAAEVEAEVDPEPNEEAVVGEKVSQAVPENDDEQPASEAPADVEMQAEEEDPVQQEPEEQAEACEVHAEPALAPNVHSGPPGIACPLAQPEVPVEPVQQQQNAPLDCAHGQDDDGEEPEPPPPGLENVHDHAQGLQPVRGPLQPVPPSGGPASQRPAIGSQASPCDAAPGSHGRSQPPQLGPHALKPPLEGVATSGACAESDVHGSVTKARGKSNLNSKKHASRAAVTKNSLGVSASAGTGKKAALHNKRGAAAVAAAKQLPVASKAGAVVRSTSLRVYCDVL
jgi:hypothetical protein